MPTSVSTATASNLYSASIRGTLYLRSRCEKIGSTFKLCVMIFLPTVALTYIHRLHQSPAPELDTGTFRQSATLLVSGDYRGFHVDANAILTEQVEEPVRRGQFAQTLSISRPFFKSTISGEIWHFSQPLIKGNTVGNLWALSYPVKPNLVIDGGFNHGLTSTATQWEGFVGFTYLFPHRLWRSD